MAMLVDCPGCGRSYTLSVAELGDGGRSVECPRCAARWWQTPNLAFRAPPEEGRGAAAPEHQMQIFDEPPAPDRVFRIPAAVWHAAGALTACAMLAALVVGREGVVRNAPRLAAAYAAIGLPVNSVGLVFARVTPQRLASDDVTIRGAIRNVAGRKVAVPRLTYEVRDEAGTALVAWSESTGTRSLGAGREVAFQSAPHRLPAAAAAVLVRFD